MATIDELMAGKKPGEILICLPDWPKTQWFRPISKYKDDDRWWGQTSQKEEPDFWYGQDDWQFWQEPVEEVEVFEWIFKPKNNDGWVILDALITDEEAEKYFIDGDQRRKTGRSWKVPR